MNPAIINAVTRHILTAVGAGLAVKYGLDGADVEAAVGAIATIVAVVWSVYDKKKGAKSE